MSKNVWIINQYASTPETSLGGRHFYLAKELAKQGHTVYVVAASYTHLLRNPKNFSADYHVEDISGFKFVWVNVPRYAHAHDRKRIMNWFKFAWKIRRLPDVILDRPDVVLFSSPSLIPFLSAKKLAKKFNAKLAFEVRDIWPLTFIEIGGYSIKHPFIRLLQWIEHKAYRESDVVLSNLPNAVEHMKACGMEASKFSWIPNGIDLDEILNPEPLHQSFLKAIPSNKFLVGYTGTLGVANSLDTLIKAARILKAQTDLAFVLVGSGKERDYLKCQAKDLDNVIFIDSVKKTHVQSVLKVFDVCFIGWRNEWIYRFGIAPNKLPEYMIAAKPIIHAYSGFFDFVSEAKAGISVPAEDPQAIADAVIELKSRTDEELKSIGLNGHLYVLKNHNYSYIADKLVKALGL